MSSEARIADLIHEVTAAFDGVAREDGTTLHEGIAIDDRKSEEEQLTARRLDRELRWQDVPPDSILASCAVPTFLDEKGFRYYLPAFIVYGLRHWDTLTTSILDSCEYRLLLSEPASIAATLGFTDAQSRAVAHFLRFYVEDDCDVTPLQRERLDGVAKWEDFVGERVPST